MSPEARFYELTKKEYIKKKKKSIYTLPFITFF